MQRGSSQLGEHAIENSGVMSKGLKSRIAIHARDLPWVATESQIQKDDTKGPDIGLGGDVGATELLTGQDLRLLFGGHVERRTAAKVGGDTILGGEAEIGQFQSSISGDENVLGLEIAVEDLVAV